MVVWLKPCESRSSPGFTPKTPLLAQRGFSLRAVIQVVPAAGRQPDGVTSPARSTPCVDALCEEAWRQPRLAATNRLPASGRHYRQIHTSRGSAADGTQKKSGAPVGRRSALNNAQSSMARLYLAEALSFIIASRAALNGLPAYQFGQRSPPASSLPTPYISCRSSTVPSSFQVAASNSSFGPW